MNRRFLWWTAAVAALLMLIGLTGVDRPLAESIRGSELEHARVFDRGTEALDLVTLKSASHNSIGTALALAGLLWWAAHRASRAAKILALTGASGFCTSWTIIALKDSLGRLRPVESFQRGDWDHTWFAGGSSFPSGHAGYYFGLLLPLAAAYPRARWPLLAIASFVALARLDVSVHFMSDVSASVVIAAMYAVAASHAYEHWTREPETVKRETVTG
jgi:membrane-associated phospholipid phosphatase